MPSQSDSRKLSAAEFDRQIRGQLIPLGRGFSYFSLGLNFASDDVKEYLEEPIQAIPPQLRSRLPEIAVVLVPYLAKGDKAAGEQPPEDWICFEPPPEADRLLSSRVKSGETATLLFALKDQDVGEYHYRLFQSLAALGAEVAADELRDEFGGILRDELSAGAHGEVDEDAWDLKQAVIRRQTNVRRKTKGFEKYAAQAFVDTLTLYLHGICCDIDIETGPRQLASRHMRRRLELLQTAYPPPEGYAVFPEDMDRTTES